MLIPALLLACIISAIGFYIQKNNKHIVLFADASESIGGDNDIEARTEWELARLADPATGKIPDHMRQKELAYAAELPKLEQHTAIANGRSATSLNMNRRGPWNVGGRTRALAIDVTNENIILAGAASGGVWRSTDAGATWTRVSRLSDNESITYITQDLRAGHTNTWYYSTGEPNIGYGGTFGLGNGIFKSTDGGITWNVLSATSSNSAHSFDSNWDLTYKVVCDPSNTANDVVYAACYSAIYKSTNGGSTWVDVRGSVSGSPTAFYTDVDVTSTGIVYATLTSESTNFKGIWRKDATAWANITPPAWTGGTYNRVVIGINPSNENEVYFLGETPNMGKSTTNYKGDIEWNSLWKYTYISGNGTGAGGSWVDLSANIPYDASQLGNFNSQGGYDLIVKVHPDFPNIVYIGGTNLYRSTDGFTTSTNTTHIGGYAPGSTIPFYTNYPSHHSDQHNLVFLPSNHDVMLSSSDGGINKTNDNRASIVVWHSLNDGYVVTQFYTIAIDHGSTPNDIVIGGLQDNGSWFTNNTNYTTPWAWPGQGDGAFCAIDDGHANYYMSRQEGRVARATLDANGGVTAFRRIDPIGGSNYLFINPFVLDPNNRNIMYLGAGNRVWRNDSLTSIPLTGQWDSISMGWFRMPDSVQASGNLVTALAVSKTPANRLYIGTKKKIIYRVDNANTSTPVMTDITSSLSTASGYVNCIAIDPNDGNKIMAVYSSYSVYSLFYSVDAGSNWTKVAGNLEQNSNTTGIGNGPSVLWASIIPVPTGTVYLVGTSVGLFGTNVLDGTSTVWTQLAPDVIGNMIVNMMDFRTNDGLVAIGTYGAGVFSANIIDSLATNLAVVNPLSFDITTYPNPSSDNIFIRFYSNDQTTISLTVYDATGNLVESIVNEKMLQGQQQFMLQRKNRAAGIYFIQLKANGKTFTKKIAFTS